MSLPAGKQKSPEAGAVLECEPGSELRSEIGRGRKFCSPLWDVVKTLAFTWVRWEPWRVLRRGGPRFGFKRVSEMGGKQAG